MRRIDSSDNIRVNNIAQHEIYRNKSESPDPFRHNNFFPQNINYINNINNFNQNINGNPMMFNNKINSNCNNNNNYNQNHLNNNINNINTHNINLMNNLNNNFRNINPINNINSMMNINNNSPHNCNNNLNMSYNFDPNKNIYINDSMEDIYSTSKKRGDSFNSCPSLRGNHFSFNKANETNNNININNFSHNSLFNNEYKNQNYLSMQKLFLNLNPYTASLMRNNVNMNNIINNNYSHFNINNQKFFNHINNNNYFNNYKYSSAFNISDQLNEQHKKSHSTKGSHNLNDNFRFNTNNYMNMNFNNNNNSSIDGNISNDNLSYSSIESNKAQLKKKRTSLFQNGCNKEKDLRDFKRFCDGLKVPMPDYICSQIGSRIMQKYLKKFPSYIRTLLINKISIYFKKLMCNTYGNYFCQKLYNISELYQRILILNSLKDCFLEISKNNCGAHVTQFIIDAAQSEDEKKLISEYISNHELELAFDPEGTHVLQKVICCFPENEREDLNNILYIPENLNALSQDAKGMCVMKKLIANTKNKDNKMKILDGVYSHCNEIAQNPFGNYVIQYIFEEWDVDICFNLIKSCVENSVIFSTQKYSSNIIAKIIDLYSNVDNTNYTFIQDLTKIFFDVNNIFVMYNNKYGRLLLIKLSKLIGKEEKEKIIKIFENDDAIKNILNELFE